MQRLALFDLDDTLIDRRRALEATLTRFASRHGLTVDERDALLVRLDERAGAADFSVIRELHGLSPSARTLWQEYLADMAAFSVCPDEVLDGLDDLKGHGWRIGIATNGSADIQRAKLEATGIAQRVDAVCVSADLGLRKPDPRLFATAVELCGATPNGGGWMVGDDPVKDIAGGRSAGLATLWIGTPDRWPGDLHVPDLTAPTVLSAIRLLLEHTAEGGTR
ncbi:HAD-IA family hydrolase [Streptomyces sp. NBC_01214]|uniref:HAD family hydrolase n=1 Tax=Streptomyces sp. NBC_01214 TaxID=2903777 RepID=UPI00225291F9|nr:HAD-IA family hydrolase [Streptomyces sp. NBC_01214]MCX4801469.1 HAD-IA family hydrolase [Streptomyces sp. NBC_01214]